MRSRVQIVILILSMIAIWQNSQEARANEVSHYPRLLRAEIPLYPPVAATARISGSVSIMVVVEKGTVVSAEVKSASSPWLSNPAIANLKTWQFVEEERASFLVDFLYQIEGEETPQPENSKVEMDLPRHVKITMRPFKPTRSD